MRRKREKGIVLVKTTNLQQIQTALCFNQAVVLPSPQRSLFSTCAAKRTQLQLGWRRFRTRVSEHAGHAAAKRVWADWLLRFNTATLSRNDARLQQRFQPKFAAHPKVQTHSQFHNNWGMLMLPDLTQQ
jgi:hypothetical protein